MAATVFIDGQAGTTGLQITERLQARTDIELLYLSNDDRKDSRARAECLSQADVSILCLPDDAAREAVKLADGRGRILDASTAHRTDDTWSFCLDAIHHDTNQNATPQKSSPLPCQSAPCAPWLSLRVWRDTTYHFRR